MQDFSAATSIPALPLWVVLLLSACIGILAAPTPSLGSALVASSFCSPRSTAGLIEGDLLSRELRSDPASAGSEEGAGVYFLLVFQKIFPNIKISIEAVNYVFVSLKIFKKFFLSRRKFLSIFCFQK
jgi:hypothetical protein